MKRRPQIIADRIYQHYVNALEDLGNEEAIGAASALRNMNVIANILRRWRIPRSPVSLSAYYRSLDAVIPRGELKNRARWVLDSCVGNLLDAAFLSQTFDDEVTKLPIIPHQFEYACIPRCGKLFQSRIVPGNWMKWFHKLSREIIAFDKVQRQLLTNTSDLRSLLFHAYMMASTLHQTLSILDFADSWRRK